MKIKHLLLASSLLCAGTPILSLAQEDGSAPAQETLQTRIERLIIEMRAQDYDTRIQAQRQLIAVGAPALPFLRKAAKSDDPEQATLAGEAIEEITHGSSQRSSKDAEPEDFRIPGGSQHPDQPSKLKRVMPKYSKAFKEFFRSGGGNAAAPSDDQGAGAGQEPQTKKVRVWSWTTKHEARHPSGLEGSLGMKVGSPNAVLRDQLEIPRGEGLVINKVLPKGWAARNGFKVYDVLLAIDDRPVYTRRDLRRLAEHGGKVELIRKAKSLKLLLSAVTDDPRAKKKER